MASGRFSAGPPGISATMPARPPQPESGALSSQIIPITNIALIAAAIGSGLIAGIFFAFSTFIMQAFARLPADQGIAAMQLDQHDDRALTLHGAVSADASLCRCSSR